MYSGGPVWPGAQGVNAVAIPVLTIPMAWRRRRPLVICLSVLATIAVTSAILGGGEATTEFLLLIAVVFSGAAYTDQPTVVATAALVAGLVHEARDPAVHNLGDAVWALGMLVIAFLLGRAVHTRQHRIGTLQHEAQEREKLHAEQVAAATAAERAAIARELHDIVAHAVSVVVIQSQAGARALPEKPELARQIFDTIEGSARTALTDLRRLLTLLSDGGTDQPESARQPAGSLNQLGELIATFRGTDLDVRLNAPSQLPVLAPAAELAAFRVVQEALTNAVRYARGSSVDVELSTDGGELAIRVRDAGGVQTHGALGTGRGLIGMEQRLRLVGGRLLRAGPQDDGFLVHATIPIAVNELTSPVPVA